MPSLSHRMRKLQTRLLAIRVGSGAMVLPKEVKRIHLRFGLKNKQGHMGPRLFWKHELVRMKYHNPAVPMTVDRTAKPEDPPTMSIHFAPSSAPQTSSSSTSSPAPTNSTTPTSTPSQHAPTDRVESIDMRNRTNSEILAEVMRITKAFPIEPTPEEKAELDDLKEQRASALVDRERSLAVRAKVKREKELLEQARGELAPAEA